MTDTAPAFAIVGRSHASEAYELLYLASLAARAERRKLGRATDEPIPVRRWRGSGEPVTLPLRLPGLIFPN